MPSYLFENENKGLFKISVLYGYYIVIDLMGEVSYNSRNDGSWTIGSKIRN